MAVGKGIDFQINVVFTKRTQMSPILEGNVDNVGAWRSLRFNVPAGHVNVGEPFEKLHCCYAIGGLDTMDYRRGSYK